jgi:hypothetical protein
MHRLLCENLLLAQERALLPAGCLLLDLGTHRLLWEKLLLALERELQAGCLLLDIGMHRLL